MTHTAETTEAPQPQMTSGKIIDRIFELREQRKALDKQSSNLDAEMKVLKQNLIERLDNEDTTIGRGSAASASITATVVPAVHDWDQVYAYIQENDAFYLLQRRLNSAPFRELLDQGTEIPGIDPMPVRDVSIRKLTPR